MENKKLIAGALLEISQRAESTFLDVSKKDKEIIEAAKKIGIVLPSPDLMVMKTVYAEIDKVNLNGVILPRKAVEEGLKTLVGKQCNWEHDGAGFICGYTISARIKEDKIETINVLFKSLFLSQAEELKEKIKSGEAAVSFEIWNVDPDTKKSVVKKLEGGIIEISPIIFHGTGVLLVHKPACPTAKIFQLVANKLTKTADEIMHKVFSENLIYASLAVNNIEEASFECQCLKCGKVIISEKHCKDIKCPSCGGDMRRKDKPGKGQPTSKLNNNSQEKEDSKVEELKETKTEETLVETKTEDTSKVEAETKAEENKVEAKPEEEKKSEVAETKAEETKVEETKKEESEAKPEEKKEVVAEEKKEEVKVEETKEVVAEEKKEEVKVEETKEVVAEEKKEETKKEESEAKSEEKKEAEELEVIEPKIIAKVTSIASEVRIVTYKDGTPSGTDEVKGYFKTITEYTNGTKDEIEEEVEIKKKYDFAELEEAVKKAKEEKDKEITKLKEELGKKDQEIAKLMVKEEEIEKEEIDLEVGEVNVEGESEIKKEAKKINDIIAAKRKA